MPDLDTEYDLVAIVDFLPKKDRKRYQLAKKLTAYLTKNKIKWHCCTCDTRREFTESLRWLAAQSQDGTTFMLQFIGHGQTNGLCMPDDTLATWQHISGFLSKIHTATLARSVLNVTSCFGLNAIKIADHLSLETCFFGILGPSTEIYFKDGYKINTKVYKKMFAGIPINQIIREVNHEFGKQILFGITAEGYKTLKAQGH